jgi:plastocyanin domain-containing protein
MLQISVVINGDPIIKQFQKTNKGGLMGKNILNILFILLTLGLLLTVSMAAERQEFIASVDKDGVQRVEIVGGSYFFKPNYIVLKVNVPVEISVSKESGMTPHDIVMQAPEAGMDFKVDLSTDPQIIRFTPTRTGKFPFYCDKKLLFFESHRDKGMEGTIEVRD